MNPPSLETMEQSKRVLTEIALRYGPRLLTAILIFAAGGLVARQVNRLAGAGWRGASSTSRWLSCSGAWQGLLVLVVFALMALQNLGVELLPLIASLGVVGVGAGLAMQGVLSNLVAGLTIILSGPFRVGEYIR